MKSLVVTAALILGIAATPAMAGKAAKAVAPPPPPVNPVVAAERDFDQYTFEHGYRHGFYQYSAAQALSFQPAPVAIHDKLAAAIAADSSEADAPSKLRWWPGRVGMASSGDLAYDLGGWTNGDDPKGGWFLTVWQLQADGTWKWVIDTGAGSADVSALWAKDVVEVDIPPFATSDSPKTAWTEITASDAALNKGLNVQDAGTAYHGFLTPISVVLGDDGAPATTLDAQTSALAARPAALAWTMDGIGESAAGDFGYTYGHAATDDHFATIKGYYVRVWRKDAASPDGWRIVADLFHAAK